MGENATTEVLTRNAILKKFKKKTPMQEIVIRFTRNRMAVVGMIIFGIILLCAIFADFICDYDTMVIKLNVAERLQGPSLAHWLGTDKSGRDVFARIITVPEPPCGSALSPRPSLCSSAARWVPSPAFLASGSTSSSCV